MMLTATCKLAAISLLSTLIPTLAIGQTISLPPPNQTEQTADKEAAATKSVTPYIRLEKSQSYVLDNYIRAFQAPITGSDGKVRYYDVTVKLKVKSNGTLEPVAQVSASRSPSITTGVIVPGTYKNPDGSTSCKVNNMTLTNGRIQSFFNCKTGTSYYEYFEISIATGRITDGHPYLNELVAAGIDKRPDVNTYAWGMITSGSWLLSSWYQVGWLIGAKTDGSRIILSLFNSSGFSRSQTFTR